MGRTESGKGREAPLRNPQPLRNYEKLHVPLAAMLGRHPADKYADPYVTPPVLCLCH